MVALLSGIAHSREALGQSEPHSKNRDPVSVLRVRTSWSLVSLPLSSSQFCPLAPYCHVLPSWYLTATSAAPALRFPSRLESSPVGTVSLLYQGTT